MFICKIAIIIFCTDQLQSAFTEESLPFVAKKVNHESYLLT